MPTDDIRVDILFKKALGLPDAFPNKPSSNEVAVGSNRPAVFPDSQIYQQPIPAIAPTDLSLATFTVGNGATQLGGSPAIKQVSTAYPYIAKYSYIPLIDATGTSNNKVSYCYNIGNNNILQKSISSAYDIGGSYGISLYTNAGNPLLSTNTTDGWVIDNDSGVVTFTNSTASYTFTSGPPFITFWRYEGAFGIQSFSTNLTMNGDVSINSRLFVSRISESIANPVAGATTFDYSTGSVFNYSLTSSANITANFTNVNPSAVTNRTFVASLIISGTNKGYANALQIGGVAYSNYFFNGGVSTVSVTSASIIVQTFAFVYTSSGTSPLCVLTNVASYQA